DVVRLGGGGQPCFRTDVRWCPLSGVRRADSRALLHPACRGSHTCPDTRRPRGAARPRPSARARPQTRCRPRARPVGRRRARARGGARPGGVDGPVPRRSLAAAGGVGPECERDQRSPGTDDAQVSVGVSAAAANAPWGPAWVGAWPFAPFEQDFTLHRDDGVWRITAIEQRGVGDVNLGPAFVAYPTLTG